MIGDKIRLLRKANGWSQLKLSELLNENFNLKTDRVMVSKWETGFQTPVIYTVSCMAKLFNVSLDFLNDEEYSSFRPPQITDDVVTYPVIGEIAAGFDSVANEDWSGETVEIPKSYLRGRRYEDFFVLTVKGNSMYPMYLDGDKVLIQRQASFNNNGDVCAVIYDGELGTLKKVYRHDDEKKIELRPINPEYMPKVLTDEAIENFTILGIPKTLIRDIK